MSYEQYSTSAQWNVEPPLWLPHYGARFFTAVRRYWRKYATFSGRASRSEYWWSVLFTGLVGLVIDGVDEIVRLSMRNSGMGGFDDPSDLGAALAWIWAAIIFIPTISILVRRLHDINMSGWMIFIGLFPLIGAIVLLVFTLMRPNPAGRRFDNVPSNATLL
ncbi:uncharacterized membrane protein YhaH (DUF805 family) [Arthrobacter pigmenti]|uniref:Uncharacterized membrane protein YhaH (DUF805 family) n=1 Tax=Arthrobacter pigmenti TaxID=271432 RepID=A0A846RRZ9_9MICC|nr:DUF805 domain-containing protein [Arthrobacter pigmenti]NJC23829.1 uncharacterized membrane protein YhaH (DUF805 family) [Arthrobacter pigmenti]